MLRWFLPVWKLVERREYILKNTLELPWLSGHLKQGDSLGSSSIKMLPGAWAGMDGPDT